MFRDRITQTVFTSLEAAECFGGRIDSYGFNSVEGDQTFLSTLCALVEPRLPADDTLFLHYSVSSYGRSALTGHNAAEIVSDMVSGRPNNGTIMIVSIECGTTETNKLCLDYAREATAALFSGYTLVEKVTVFFRQRFDVLCFICPDDKSVILYATGLTLANLHYLQCGIPAYLPWFFTDNTLREDEMELITSLKETSSTHYLACLNKIAQKYDFRERRIRRMLAGFESRAEIKKRDASRTKIENIWSQIEEYNSAIANLLRQKKTEEIALLGLETKLAQATDDSEIMEYFMCNKNLSLINVGNDCIKFACKGYLLYFDEDMAKKLIDNDTSYIYSGSGIRTDNMKKLMYAIFVDQTLRMRFCAAYHFELGVSVSGISHNEYGSEFADCMPNPHIDSYACLGNYRQTLNELVQANNYIGAIEQCMASCKSLNFGDSTVMRKFIQTICGTSGINNRCIELPDGTVVTPKKAIKWLNGQEGETESNE